MEFLTAIFVTPFIEIYSYPVFLQKSSSVVCLLA